jgi:membrane-associated phospholipid phosphatase
MMTTCRQRNIGFQSSPGCAPERDRSAMSSQGITRVDCRTRWRACAWTGLVLSGAGATFLIYLLLDEPVRQWLLLHPNTWHEHNWVNAFRQLGKAYVPIWLVLLWSCLTNRWRTTALTLMALVFVGLSVGPLKVLASRPRPNDPARFAEYAAALDAHHAWEHRVSFPSGDTAGAFAVAVVLALSIRRSWAVLFLVAAGPIGLLRVTALAHYPSDVSAGMMIGVLAGWWSVHWAIRWFPEDAFLMSGRGRILLGVLLVVLVPLLSPFVGMKGLLVFLRFYGAPVAALLLLGAHAAKRNPHPFS